METRNALDKDGNIIGMVTMPEGTPEDVWTFLLSRYSEPSAPLSQLVYDRLAKYEKSAPGLLRDLKTSNTLAGITLAQSAQVITDFSDVLVAIREGCFPTAIYMLQNKVPSGFITQPMINDMMAKITAKL